MSGGIERVVVPLDAAADDRIAIDTATRLAARIKAPLHGVFVEDEELLWAAALRFTRQSTLGAAAEPFTLESTALALQAAAARARQEFAAAAEQAGLRWSFEIVRGPAARALAGVGERDLVVAGGVGRPVAGHFRLESRWFQSIDAAIGRFLFARHAWNAEGSVAILLRSRGTAAGRLLAAAAQIAEARGIGLIVLHPAEPAGDTGLEAWIAEQLGTFAVPRRIEITPAEPALVEERILALGCRLLAIETEPADGVSVQLRRWALRAACDILVVR
jgi:hypothetical protein